MLQSGCTLLLFKVQYPVYIELQVNELKTYYALYTGYQANNWLNKHVHMFILKFKGSIVLFQKVPLPPRITVPTRLKMNLVH